MATNMASQTVPTTPPSPFDLNNVSSGQLQSGYNQASQTANQMSADTPQWTQATQQQLEGQAQLPQITNQYGIDTGTFMKLLANDPLGQRYLNPNSNAYSSSDQVGNAFGTDPNAPGVVSALPEATLGNVNQGFQGFTDPTLAFTAGSTEQESILNTLNALQGLFGYNQGIAWNQLGQDEQSRAQEIANLSNIANTFLNLYQAKQAGAGGGGSGFGSGTTGEAGSVLSQIIDQVQQAKGGKGSEYDLFQYLNTHQSLLAAQGVNMNEVWKLYHQMFGKSKDMSLVGGKTKATTSHLQSKKIGNKTYNFDSITGKYYDPTTGKEVNPNTEQGGLGNVLGSLGIHFGGGGTSTGTGMQTQKPTTPTGFKSASKSDLTKKLKAKGFNQAQIDEYLQTLQKQGYYIAN